MRIACIVGSPRGNEGACGEILRRMKPYFARHELDEIEIQEGADLMDACFRVNDADGLVIISPLYFDGLPSEVLRFMEEMEFRARHKGVPCACVIACGYYEGEQAGIAVSMIENWCRRISFHFTMGAGVGAAGVLQKYAEKDTSDKVFAGIGGVFAQIALSLASKERREDQYFSLSVPRFLYKKAVEKSWRKMIRENGLSSRDLYACPVPETENAVEEKTETESETGE